jgi:hypothetical protein
MLILCLCFLLNSCTEWLNNLGCANFHRAKNVADLVKQMYDHVDKKCLYQQNGQALSKKLGISVVSSIDFQDSREYVNYWQNLQNKDCQTELDGVIIDLQYSKYPDHETRRAKISLNACHIKKYGGFEKNTAWLTKLPSMKEEELRVSHCFAENTDEFLGNYTPPIFRACHEYSWPQKGQGKMTLSVYNKSDDLSDIDLDLDE